MDAAERGALFRLAVPELRSASLADRSTAMLDAFGSLRRLTRALWTATTEAEALTIVREYAMTQFAADAVVTFSRVGEGRWERAATGFGSVDEEREKQLHAIISERWGDGALDQLLCYTLMAAPGELMVRAARDARFPDLAAKDGPAFDAVGWADASFAMANVRSQHGSVARILAHHATAHAYSEIERAQLSTLADVTSLALSG
jgi:hypothetical protein